jgi:ATP-dependent DNA helicase RecG
LHQGADLRDRADATGPLLQVIDEGAAIVAHNRRLVPRMEGIRRVDVPEYSDFSVPEAIANAVARGDWTLEGAKVQLFIFDDQLEICIPGKLPPPITLERLGFDQFSRNKVIARVPMEPGYIEEVGLSIRRWPEETARLYPPKGDYRKGNFGVVVNSRSSAAIHAYLFLPWTNKRTGSCRRCKHATSLMSRLFGDRYRSKSAN